MYPPSSEASLPAWVVQEEVTVETRLAAKGGLPLTHEHLPSTWV